jgi:hypothetical protein
MSGGPRNVVTLEKQFSQSTGLNRIFIEFVKKKTLQIQVNQQELIASLFKNSFAKREFVKNALLINSVSYIVGL